jgi:hypothetical protein
VYQVRKTPQKITPRHGARAERLEVRGVHLAVDHPVTLVLQLPDQRRQR